MQLYYEGEFKAEVTIPRWVERLWTAIAKGISAIATGIYRVLTWIDQGLPPSETAGGNPEYECYGRLM